MRKRNIFSTAGLIAWTSLALDCSSTTPGQSQSDLSAYVGLWSCRIETSRVEDGALGDGVTTRVVWQIFEAGDGVVIQTRETACTDTFSVENDALTFQKGDMCKIDGVTYATQSSSLSSQDGLLTGSSTVRAVSSEGDSEGTWTEKRQIACVPRDAADASMEPAGGNDDAGTTSSSGGSRSDSDGGRSDSDGMATAGGRSAQGGSSGALGDGGAGGKTDAGSEQGGRNEEGGMPSSGGSGSGGSGGGQCGTCRDCCEAENPDGAQVYAAVLVTCKCTVCGEECADELCAPVPQDPTPGGACAACVAEAEANIGTALVCIDSITTECVPDPSCQGFAACLAVCP